MMAPDAEIYDYRVFGRWGINTIDAIYRAINDAIEEGCDIINMSLGADRPFNEITRAVKRAHDEEVILVAAAGNDGDGNILTSENA